MWTLVWFMVGLLTGLAFAYHILIVDSILSIPRYALVLRSCSLYVSSSVEGYKLILLSALFQPITKKIRRQIPEQRKSH